MYELFADTMKRNLLSSLPNYWEEESASDIEMSPENIDR